MELATAPQSPKFQPGEFLSVSQAAAFFFLVQVGNHAWGSSGPSEPSASLGDLHGSGCQAWPFPRVVLEPIGGRVVQRSTSQCRRFRQDYPTAPFLIDRLTIELDEARSWTSKSERSG